MNALLLEPPLDAIITPGLLSYTNEITFPLPIESKLDGAEVGRIFFAYDATTEWSSRIVKEAVLSLSKLGLENIKTEHLISLLGNPAQSLPKFWHKAVGLILLLDQAPRHLCKGVHARYTYAYFSIPARNIVRHLLSLPRAQNPFILQPWTEAGVEINHAFLRIAMLLAPLDHSDVPADHELHLRLEGKIRGFHGSVMRLRDPYFPHIAKDLKDIYLFPNLLKEGPPQRRGTGPGRGVGGGVRIEQFVYWILRYFTAHVAFMRWFGRRPTGNAALGRENNPGKGEWIGLVGAEDDDAVREEVKRDVERGVWRELEL
jgi:hypothetical protein